jgi:hypothetical protein
VRCLQQGMLLVDVVCVGLALCPWQFPWDQSMLYACKVSEPAWLLSGRCHT